MYSIKHQLIIWKVHTIGVVQPLYCGLLLDECISFDLVKPIYVVLSSQQYYIYTMQQYRSEHITELNATTYPTFCHDAVVREKPHMCSSDQLNISLQFWLDTIQSKLGSTIILYDALYSHRHFRYLHCVYIPLVLAKPRN